MAYKSSKKAAKPTSVREALRAPRGPIEVEKDFDPSATPLYPGKGKSDAQAQLDLLQPRVDDLQERLYANSKTPQEAPKVLLVLQGMDGSGKGGTVRHVVGLVDPQGLHIHAFKAPTPEELQHDFLWRIRQQVPVQGQIGVFDRSHYEDVLIGRVNQLVSPDEIEARYDAVNAFEAELASGGAKVVKCFLNISNAESKRRLADRLADPDKYYKYNPGDVDVRLKWPQYMQAYGILLERCNADNAPWYVVPSDRKWYRNWAITMLLIETLDELNLTWPPATFDVKAEHRRVAAS